MMNFHLVRPRLSLLILVLATALGGFAHAAPSEPSQEAIYDEAKTLLAAGNSQAAYALLVGHEQALSGNDAYDYLLGISALESGETGDALFSLQRLLARRPAFSGARLELARVYYELGDNELARKEFQQVLSEDPPAAARQTINNYLEAIKVRERTYKASTQFFVDVGAGYDSNAPAATDESQFLTFNLSSNNLEQDSFFGQLSAGGVYSRPVSPESTILVSGTALHRSNPSTHFVDPSVAMLGSNWIWRAGRHQTNVGVLAMAMQTWLDGQSNKTDYGLSGNYQFRLNEQWRVNSSLQVTAARYEDNLEIQDVDQVRLSLGLDQNRKGDVLNVSLIGLHDEEKQSGSRFGNDGYGLRSSYTWALPRGSRAVLSASFTSTEYEGDWFGEDREDNAGTIGFAYSFANFPSRKWTLTCQLNYSKKDSTVDLYSYERWEAGVSVRRTFD